MSLNKMRQRHYQIYGCQRVSWMERRSNTMHMQNKELFKRSGVEIVHLWQEGEKFLFRAYRRTSTAIERHPHVYRFPDEDKRQEYISNSLPDAVEYVGDESGINDFAVRLFEEKMGMKVDREEITK